MAVVVVTGPPTAGKSRYVAEHARPDDVRIDYDELAQALGSSQHHGHAPWFNEVVGKARWAAIKAALNQARENPSVTVYIIDSVIPDYRMRAYEAAGAEFVRLEVDRQELHRRADAERPALWHRLIDDWAPLLRDAGPSWKPEREQERKPWPKRPAYRDKAHGWRYEKLRKQFLARHDVCQRCGGPFVTDAPCAHKSCRRTGRGCHFHPLYPSVQHTVFLADGGPSLDLSTWEAWHLGENTAEGGRISQARQRARSAEREAFTSLDW